eukprot:1143623-Pelagomonas_calceolata.AAC.2
MNAKTSPVFDAVAAPFIKYAEKRVPAVNGKGDTLAQKSRESPPPRSYKKKTLMGIWRVIGSTQLHNQAARSILVFNSASSGNKLVGIHESCNMTEWA